MGQEREESHAHGVWLWEDRSRAEDLLAVRHRILMGLEEGLGKTPDKGGSKIRITGCCEKGLQERKAGCLYGGKEPQPLLLLSPEKLQPAAQLGKGDGEPFTERLHCREAQEILGQDTEDKEQAVAGVRDDEIGKDGVGMAAGTDQAQDAEAVADRGTAYKINQGTAVAGMDPAGTFCPTAGAGLKFGAEPGHEGVKQGF